jgi:hypothetical protein
MELKNRALLILFRSNIPRGHIICPCILHQRARPLRVLGVSVLMTMPQITASGSLFSAPVAHSLFDF